ncbi:hypothetical protein J7643_07005 [bacterium]|nr:hypothetical protein [bacterium]
MSDDFSAFSFDPFQTSYGFEVPQELLAPQPVSNQPPLGMLLVEAGVLTEEQLTQAVQAQYEQQVPLVQVLLEGGFATQDQVLNALRARPHYG